MEQIDRYLNKDSKPRTNPANKLPQEYYEYLDVFNREAAKKLPSMFSIGKQLKNYPITGPITIRLS